MLTQDDALFLKKKIPEWRKDPVKFVKEVWGVEPTEQQKQFLRAIAKPGAKVSIKSGHGTGKTTGLAWVIHWFLICYDKAKVPVTAPTAAQLKDALWDELKMWWNLLPPQLHDLFEWTSDHFTSETGSFAMARTASKDKPEALQGIHADNILFLIDEASGVAEEVFIAAGSSLSAENARVAMASNPTQTTGYFYASHNKNRNLWQTLTFNGEESPRVSQAYIDSIANEYGKDSDVYRVRVLGEFPLASDMQFIGMDIVETAMQRYENLKPGSYEFAPVIIGVDPAYDGDDDFAMYLRQGLYSKLLGIWPKNDNDGMMARILADFEDQYRADAVMIDKGCGMGLQSFGKVMGRNWQVIAFGGTDFTGEGYLNNRVQMWAKMKQWLIDGGAIEYDDKLKADLIGPMAWVNEKGLIQLEKKEMMKKRGVPSPNRADALALTFAMPVIPDKFETKFKAAKRAGRIRKAGSM